MQTSPSAVIISEIAHSTEANISLRDNQVVVYDTRLRNWLLAASGGLAYANPVVAKLNADGEMVRIRTLAGSPYLYAGTLDIRYATPGTTITWSSNTITADALSEAGVDIWVNGNTIDAFWVDSDAVTIKTAQSTDGGHTWGAESTVTTRSGQGLDVAIQLCTPMEDVLVFSDSTVGEDEDSNSLTALYMTMKVSGSWITPVLWDLGGQPMGIEAQVELPNGNTHPSNLSGVPFGSGKVALSFYGQAFRESFEDGVWIQRVAGIDTTVSTQHLYWGSPEEIFQTIGIDDDNNSTQIFSAFPRLQLVDSEYWILALESSEFAGHQRYHLGMFRSVDGYNWSDRSIRQGAANDDQVFAYAYDSTTPFLYTDLIYANLVVTDDYTYIVGFDKVFYCPSTILVGIDNPAKKLDLTPYVVQSNVTLPTAPTAGTATYELGAVPKDWDDEDILTAHRGVVIKQFSGYYASDAQFYTDDATDEFVQVGEFHVDELSQHTENGVASGSVQGIDNTMLLDRFKSDKFWEWDGSSQLSLSKFCDLSPFIVVAGSFTTGIGGRMRSGVVTKGDNFPDNIAVLNMDDSDGGVLVTHFRCDRTWQNCHVGVAFQGKAGDNKNFWAVLYNRKNNGRFTLNQAIPRVDTNRLKLYKYRSPVASSAAITLNPSEAYWMRVSVWHSHVIAEYSSDGINWTKVIDYTAPASPISDVIPCRMEWWGLIGVQRTEPSGAIGNTRMANAMQNLFSGSNPRMVALHIHLGSEPSLLRRVNVAVTQENENNTPMPDMTVLLLAGDTTSPYDATDDDNVMFSYDASALYFSAHDAPSWNGVNNQPNPERIRLQAGEDVWVAVVPNGTLAAGQTYKWASDDSGVYGTNQTKYSDDDGATWNSFGDANLNLTASIEVEYLNGRVKFFQLHFGSGEQSYTYEKLIKQLAAKSGVLEYATDDFLAQADLTLEADNIYWQPEAYGTIGDMVLDVDCEPTGSPYARIARVIVGSTTTGVGDGDGYIIELDPDEQTIAVYEPGNVLVSNFTSLQYISDSFHLQIVKQNYFLYIYINECLAGIQWHNDLFNHVGYIGLDSVGATWSNTRVPDMHQLVEYWALEQNESAMSSIQKLVAKPAVGTIARGRFFINYEGKLRFGSFSRRTVVDTYEDTMFGTDKSESARYVVSEIVPTGNYYATRFDPESLSSDGLWMEQRDVTDGRSDKDAYTASELEFMDSKEKQNPYNLDGLANYAAEREDVITVVNPLDGTNGTYIINDLTFSQNKSVASQRLGLRKFVES